MSRADEPAMPTQWYDFQPETGAQVVREQFGGLTIREHFAAMAMQGMLAHFGDDNQTHDTTVKMAVQIADRLIAQISQPTTER